MIILKLSFGEKEPERNFDVVPDELLKDAVTRALEGVPLNGREPSEVFDVVVNGKHIEKDFWELTKLRAEDVVLLTPSIKSGESGQIFKQVLLIAVTIVASYYLGPAGANLTGMAFGAALAAVTVGSSLLLNALIPPPVYEPEGFNGPPGYTDSQSFSIAGQSNTVRRFGLVPRVYGEHRFFPAVAANPYTVLETDPSSGKPVQYLYCIYDFGMGPAYVTDLKIGDTPLDNNSFGDFFYNFVDPNKPDISTGAWDDIMQKEFTLYKGDVEGASISVGLNGNSEDGDPEEEYEAKRTTAPNLDGSPQEIILNFVNPGGLYGYSSTGVRDFRKVQLEVHFATVGEAFEEWKPYNDPTFVSHFDSVGGQTGDFETTTILASDGDTGTSIYYEALPLYSHPFYLMRVRPGVTKLLVERTPDTVFSRGRAVYLNGDFFAGNILAVTDLSSALTELELDRPIYFDKPVLWYNPEYRRQTVQMPVRSTSNGLGVFRIKREDTAPVYSTVRFTPLVPGQFKVRVRRINTSGPYNGQTSDKLTWGTLATRFLRNTIFTDKRHVFLELKIKATNQLSGTIQDLSGVVSSALEVYDPDTTSWSWQLTNNPAWVFTDMLIGQVNKKAVEKSRLHLPSILAWADFCDEIPTPPPTQTYADKRFTTNFVLDFSTTLQAVLNQVAGAAQASLNLIDGKYGVLIDKLQSTPVQIFTPRNSKDFSSTRLYSPRPHALKIKYVDPGSDWSVVETTVYDSGYDEVTATEFEEMTTFACTSPEQAWRFGRYMLFQNRLRQETISLTVDFEHLVCTRGDYVQITQDVMRVGGTPARVKSVVGSIVTIDDALEIDLDLDYGYVFRSSSTGVITTDTCSPIEPRIFDLDGDIPAVGDLIIIGEVGSVVYDCMVKAIAPNDDLSASITLVERAAAIYDYESTGVLPTYSPQLSATTNPDFKPPGPVENLVVADNRHECAAGGNGYEYFIDIAWDPPSNSIYELFEVTINDGTGADKADTTRSTVYTYQVDPLQLGVAHTIKVVAVSAGGRKIPLVAAPSVTATPISKSTLPSNVEKLTTDITNEVIQLYWPKISDCDVKEYIIRYAADVQGTWETSIPLMRVSKETNLISTQARAGSYFIKAIDFNGNKSATAAVAITTIPNLFNLNVLDTISDDPTFDGPKDRTEAFGESVLLSVEVPGDASTQAYYSEGYYYYNDLLDLGEIYTVRLQSLLKAGGFTANDLMSNWLTLDSIALLSSTTSADWSLESQYRSTDQFNVIADWTDLSSILALNEGLASQFTEWRNFFMGDVTGRVFQFRLHLISHKPSVTPRVLSGTIQADMPDRIDSYENLLATDVDGYELAYNPAFKGPSPSPNVQVSIDGAESGDYWSFDYKNLEGLLIRFYDKNDVAVERQFDIAIKGYGRRSTITL